MKWLYKIRFIAAGYHGAIDTTTESAKATDRLAYFEEKSSSLPTEKEHLGSHSAKTLRAGGRVSELGAA
ncbi:MAG: hypothetical protein EG828_01175 [Deltaproteobacteria bacterium]|nr:hypothetical protein [Deltaproteobacteria bacterium]